MEYKYSKEELFRDLTLLNNNECLLRILHEVRIKKQYTRESIEKFIALCEEIQTKFPKIKLWCGRNLYNWSIMISYINHHVKRNILLFVNLSILMTGFLGFMLN